MQRIHSRNGPHLAMIPAFVPRGRERLDRVNEWLALREIAATGKFCGFLQRAAKDRELGIEMQPSHVLTRNQPVCQFQSLEEAEDDIDLAARNQQIAEQNAELLRTYGLQFKFETCESFDSRIGQEQLPYQLCQLELSQ